ncbi:hypothetical protein [Rhizohabitans arisaemae]|uniref:hypothetical protein n=1 Tax=Rhizohabitans arisaemae TaxID=2720610 RepID=UPI0024B1C33B|nr:hypothetical protein [Rhizohabitans arisaemae]
MDLLGTLQALRRWWWVALLLFSLSVSGVGAAYALLPWSYESKANVLFLPSIKQAEEAGGNAYLVFSDSLRVSAEVTGRNLSSEATVEAFANKGFDAEYEINLATDSNGPVLDVVVTGDNPEVTSATLKALLDEVGPRLNSLQTVQGKSPSSESLIRTRVIAQTVEPQRVTQDKLRLLIVIGVAGLLVTIGIPVMIEAMAERRRIAESRRARVGVPRNSRHLTNQDPARPASAVRAPTAPGSTAGVDLSEPSAVRRTQDMQVMRRTPVEPATPEATGATPDLWTSAGDADTMNMPRIVVDPEHSSRVKVGNGSVNTGKRRREIPAKPENEPNAYKFDDERR